MNDYHSYSDIELHIHFSKKLFEVEKHGKNLIEVIKKEKCIDNRKQYLKEIADIKHILHCITENNLYEKTLYSSLLFYLDEWLFLKANGMRTFIVEDDEYPLTSIYFNRSEWLDIETEKIKIDAKEKWTTSDATKIYDYFHSYMDILDSIFEHIKKQLQLETTDYHELKILRKIKKYVHLIRNRCLKAMKMMVDILTIDLQNRIDNYLK